MSDVVARCIGNVATSTARLMAQFTLRMPTDLTAVTVLVRGAVLVVAACATVTAVADGRGASEQRALVPGRTVPDPEATACDSVTVWPPHELRTEDGRPVSIARAHFLRYGDRLIAIAPTVALPTRSASDPPDTVVADYTFAAGAIVDTAGRVQLVPLPQGFSFDHIIAPRAAIDSQHVVHVVWGAPADADTSMGAKAASLWYARFDGHAWSVPERIADATTFYWNTATPSDLIVYDGGLLLATARNLTSGGGLLFLRRHDGRWSSSILREHGGSYVRLVVGRNGVLTMVYLDPFRTPTRHRVNSSVLASRSINGGVTWSPPVLIHQSGEGEASDPRLLRTPDGAIDLLWTQRREGFEVTDSIGFARSEDGGQSWKQLPGLIARSGFETLQAAIDGAGVLHVAIGEPLAVGQVRVTSWNGESWAGIQRPPELSEAIQPTLSHVASGVYIAWGYRSSPTSPAAVVISRIRECRFGG